MINEILQNIIFGDINTIKDLLVQYVFFLALAGVSHVSWKKINSLAGTPIESPYKKISYKQLFIFGILIAPIAEELIFRGIPYFILSGLPMDIGLIIGTIIWMLLHGRYGVVTSGIYGILLVKLWYLGLWEIAILVHFVHNLWVIVAMYLWWESRWGEKPSESELRHA